MRFTTKLCTVLASISGFWRNPSNTSYLFFYFKDVMAVAGKTLKTFGLSSCFVLVFHLLHNCVDKASLTENRPWNVHRINTVCWCGCNSYRTVHEEWCFAITQSCSLAFFSSGLGSKCPFSSCWKTKLLNYAGGCQCSCCPCALLYTPQSGV